MGFYVRPGENVSIDNQERREIYNFVVGWGAGVWEPAIRETCYLEPLCGEIERDVGEETGVVIVRMNCYCNCPPT